MITVDIDNVCFWAICGCVVPSKEQLQNWVYADHYMLLTGPFFFFDNLILKRVVGSLVSVWTSYLKVKKQKWVNEVDYKEEGEFGFSIEWFLLDLEKRWPLPSRLYERCFESKENSFLLPFVTWLEWAKSQFLDKNTPACLEKLIETNNSKTFWWREAHWENLRDRNKEFFLQA